MYELVQVGPQSYYIQSPSKIGVYVRDNGEAFLIDGGSDKDAAKKVKKHLDQKGWTLKGILSTHSHADHTGGCAWLQDQTDCKIFSDGLNGAFMQWPEMEPAFLFGAYPCKDLRHKSLMAPPVVEVSELTDPDYPEEVWPVGLGGHWFLQTGYYTPDGTVFLADCLSSESTLEKYGISFLYNVKHHLDTLDYVAEMRQRSGLNIRIFVPSHAEPTEDITPLARTNQQAVKDTAERILSFCDEPIVFELLLQKVFDHYNLNMNFQQYALIGSTVRSYLSWLRDLGRVEVLFENNLMLWKKV